MALTLVTEPWSIGRRPRGTRRSALRPPSQERQLRLEIERMKEEEAMRDKVTLTLTQTLTLTLTLTCTRAGSRVFRGHGPQPARIGCLRS